MMCATQPAFPATDRHFLMFQRMLTSALFAGAAAGLIAALLHFAFVQQLILLSEQYESGALTHFSTASADPAAADDGHAHAAGTEEAGHSHEHSATASDLQRNGLTVLFMGLVYIAYGMLMTAGFGFAESVGLRIGPTQGLLWGIAGFASFQLAPALGLAPELPGTIAAELGARQVWWWGTVGATATALALLAYGRSVWMFVAAGVLLAAPHVIGAPQPDGFYGLAPPEVAALFSARVLGVAVVVWACLGWIAGHFWSRPVTA
jgi:cobalt transporter subunit CbtA